MKLYQFLALFTSLAFLTGCGGTQTPSAEPITPPASADTSMAVTSEAFQNGAAIPAKYSCDGENINPALQWSGVPANVKSQAIIVEDPDAPGGTFYHWVVYNIPPGTTILKEGLSKDDLSFTQGKTSFNAIGYGGPCPPKGKAHHYYFRVYALNLEPTLAAGMNAKELQKTMEGHILSQNYVMGTFQR